MSDTTDDRTPDMPESINPASNGLGEIEELEQRDHPGVLWGD